MISIKTPEQQQIMREGGKRLMQIRDTLATSVKAGMTTGELEAIAVDLFKQSGGEPTFLGFHGYPATTCISVNEEVVHGIPGNRVIKDGDVIGIDTGLRYKGFCTDTAVTVTVGKVKPEILQLLDATKESLQIGLEQVKPGNRIGDISHAIQEAIEEYGYGIVRDLTGHGIGKGQWEEPPIPNFGRAGQGPEIKEGMALAIEPMVTLGSSRVRQLDDGWTIVTMDGSPAAHFEHTVLVTKNGYEIIT